MVLEVPVPLTHFLKNFVHMYQENEKIWRVKYKWFRHIQTHLKVGTYLNCRLNFVFGSGRGLNFRQDFVYIQKSSSLNLGSEPDYGSTRSLVLIYIPVHPSRAAVFMLLTDPNEGFLS